MLMELSGSENHPELIVKVCNHLERELADSYPAPVSRRGARLKPGCALHAGWDGDEITVSLEEKGKVRNVRMVLPLFEENGYSLTVCTCLEEKYLDEQRCHHMWFAQNLVFQTLTEKSRKLQDARPDWQKLTAHLRDFSDSLLQVQSHGAVCHEHRQLIWVLRQDLTLAPAVRQKSGGHMFRVFQLNAFLADKKLRDSTEYGRRVALQILDKKQAGSSSRLVFEDMAADLFSTLEGCSEIFIEHSGEPVKCLSTTIMIKSSSSPAGIRVETGLRGSDSDHLVLIGSDVLAGVSSSPDGNVLHFAAPGVAAINLYRFTQEAGGELPAGMCREFAQVLGGIRLHQALEYSGQVVTSCASSLNQNIYFRLTPMEPQGVIFEMLLRPLKGEIFSDLTVVPGRGAAVLLDFSALPVRELHRNLSEELKRAGEVTSFLFSDVAEDVEGGFLWRVESDEEALLVIDRLEQQMVQKERVFLEWPEGASGAPERFQVLREEDPDIKVSIEKSRDWFDLKGGFWLDGCHVSLSELIRAWQGKQKFIRLSHGKWFRISDSLRQRIAEFSGGLYVDQEGGGSWIRPSPGFFGHGLNGDTGLIVSGDSAFAGLAETIREAKNFRPEAPEGLCADLRSYQLEGFQWAAALGKWAEGGILADDMGLGKTLQAITLLQYGKDQGPSLVISPASVCENWKNELQRFAPELTPVLYRETRSLNPDWFLSKKPVVVIVSYGLLLQAEEEFVSHNWNYLIPDEAQFLKNSTGKTSKAVRKLRKNFALLLSGTPVENNPADLWSLFQIINPGLLGDAASFRKNIADPVRQKKCAKTLQLLRTLIQPYLLRRLKQDYLKELPAKTVKTFRVYLSAEERHYYDSKRMEAIASLSQESLEAAGQDDPAAPGQVRVLAWLTRLRQIVNHPRLVQPDWEKESAKESEFCHLADSLVSGAHKTLVFSQFPSFLEILAERLHERGYSTRVLRGSVPPVERQRMVMEFQNGEIDFFLISLKAGGTGLNLTRAGYVVLLDPWWNPTAEAQAMDRAYRMGQTQPVTVLRFIAQKTIEEKVVDMQSEKLQIAGQCLEGADRPGGFDPENLRQLLQE